MDIPKQKLVITVSLVGLLMVLITVFSVYHTQHLGHAYLQYPLFLYGTTILALVIGGFIVFLFEQKINDQQLVKLLALLPQDEKKLLKILFERKEIEQKKLGTLTGLSAVKVSRVVARLEQRGVIEKKKQGYTNLIFLKL
ncbi:MarR family transcriptional regulator [Candidatus Woesearchaeota archaeon]|nr:MAG: MarR family transcriptional regulator [Candidatus Woesearchaeota archaeon]